MKSVLSILGIAYFGWLALLSLFAIGMGVWEAIRDGGGNILVIFGLLVAPLTLWLNLYAVWKFKTGEIWSTNIALWIVGAIVLFTLFLKSGD